jgi:hypothetical protein
LFFYFVKVPERGAGKRHVLYSQFTVVFPSYTVQASAARTAA